VKTVRSQQPLETVLPLAVCLVAALLVGALDSAAQVSISEEHEGFVHELTADKAVYAMYEDVAIDYTVTNVSGVPVWMSFPCEGIAVRIGVVDAGGAPLWYSPSWCLDSFWYDTLAPGDAYGWTDSWDMVDYMTWLPITEPGVYTVQGCLEAYNDSLAHIVSLPITIMDDTTAVPESGEASWSTIKALYR